MEAARKGLSSQEPGLEGAICAPTRAFLVVHNTSCGELIHR